MIFLVKQIMHCFWLLSLPITCELKLRCPWLSIALSLWSYYFKMLLVFMWLCGNLSCVAYLWHIVVPCTFSCCVRSNLLLPTPVSCSCRDYLPCPCFNSCGGFLRFLHLVSCVVVHILQSVNLECLECLPTPPHPTHVFLPSVDCRLDFVLG